MDKKQTRLTLKDAAHLLEKGMIKGEDADWIKKQITANKGVLDTPKGLSEIIQVLIKLDIPFCRELKFAENRRFRFDIAIKSKMCAIEYEGIFSKHSRHTNVKGYSKDAEKYNLAQSLGWKVLRYTAMNYKNFENDIKQILENEKI